MTPLFTDYEILDYIQCIIESEVIDNSSQKLRMVIKLINKSGNADYE